ncbi:hypothetical protein CI109_103963 [Kwoniella shandongensis]|uniref:Uncharacterized protein n=1 Tax=Kwoniella shandongensis TaxID=1734106 RepID=A0A5M6BY09_9TREE|nr:uncharacterized protein CI109_004152 [Kwoniella shandongensis]KAA5527613.1 hypothetical protein CI109_004152 [Kwoniella shandongensis]
MDEQSLATAQQQQADNDALANAVAASARQLGLGSLHSDSPVGDHHHVVHHHHQPHHFHHALQQPDFSQTSHHHHQLKDDGTVDTGADIDVNVHALEIPTVDDGQGGHQLGMDGQGEPELDLSLGGMGTPGDMGDMGDMDMGDMDRQGSYGVRPPSIRKACDLCHAAKQKCSGDRPSCTRCAQGGWNCVYAPRQRRRTVPKEQKMSHSALDPMHHHHAMAHASQSHSSKKRKLGTRESIGGFGSEAMDMKMAMGMAMDMGLTGEEEGEEMQTMSDEQMLESIAIDGYLADLPLATFVHNLPFTPAPANETTVHFNNDDFPSAGDNPFPNTDMDQHTTSALRDAIFSLNESGGAGGHGEGTGEGEHGGDGQGDEHQLDPHLALLDLSNMNNDGDNNDGQGGNSSDPTAGLQLPDFSSPATTGCNHRQLVPHILSLLTQHGLEPKQGSNTPLTLAVFAPVARSLRLFHSLSSCPSCSTSPQQTLPQLALLSRTTTILTYPFPPINSSSVGSSAQITIHGARLSGTGLSEAIEQHIVGVVWDSWRASVREVFNVLDKKAQEIITQSSAAQAAAQAANGDGGNQGNGGLMSSLEKQRAGLVFQAVSRLVTAMDEVEGGN